MMDGSASLKSLLVLAVVLLTVAPAGIGAVGASDVDGTESVRTVAEIEAHFETSVDLVADGDREQAAAHARTVMEEQWPVIQPQLEAANASLAADLETAIEDAPAAARNDTPDDYASYVEREIIAKLPATTSALVPAERTENATFSAGVVTGLLERASAEYTEGVSANGTVIETMDYQTAIAYADQAKQRYNGSIAATLDEEPRSEIAELFETLDTRLQQPAAPTDVESVASAIEGELTEYTGLGNEGGAGAEAIERIESDLDAAVEAYEAGNVSRAQSLVKNTYLSNFEGVEGTLIEQDPDLVEEIEADFNERLPGLFAENASVSTVEEQVGTIEERLERAKTILAAQKDTEIDLGGGTTTGSDTASATETDTPSPDATTTATETPGFTAIGGLLAVLLGATALLTRQ